MGALPARSVSYLWAIAAIVHLGRIRLGGFGQSFPVRKPRVEREPVGFSGFRNLRKSCCNLGAAGKTREFISKTGTSGTAARIGEENGRGERI